MNIYICMKENNGRKKIMKNKLKEKFEYTLDLIEEILNVWE